MNPLKIIQSALRLHLGIDNLRYQTEGIQTEIAKLKPVLPWVRDLHAAEIFHDRIKDSPWFVRTRLAPGNWAVDYGFLNTLYNVLSAMKPRRLLEFGLGQSSKLVHQYAAYYHADAVTCEHDDDWISFFFQSESDSPGVGRVLPEQPVLTDESLGYPVNIRRLPLEATQIHDAPTTSYGGLQAAFGKEQFDFVLVDGPFGEERFSRPQTILLAEANLADRFCILMDDTQRPGEQETIAEVQEVLRRRGVPFVSVTRSYTKSHTLICSPDLRFLTSS